MNSRQYYLLAFVCFGLAFGILGGMYQLVIFHYLSGVFIGAACVGWIR